MVSLLAHWQIKRGMAACAGVLDPHLSPPGKSQVIEVAIGFLENSGRDPSQEAIKPLILLLLEGDVYSPKKLSMSRPLPGIRWIHPLIFRSDHEIM